MDAPVKIDTAVLAFVRFFSKSTMGVMWLGTIHVSSDLALRDIAVGTSYPRKVFYTKDGRGVVLHFSVPWEGDRKFSEFFLAHEAEHVTQYRANKITFYPRYLGQWLQNLLRELDRRGREKRVGWYLRPFEILNQCAKMSVHSKKAYRTMPYEIEADIAGLAKIGIDYHKL